MNTSKQVNIMLGLLALFVVATLLYWLWDPQRAEDAELRQQEVNAERGGELYGLNCRACHGLAGQGILESIRLPGVPLDIEANRPESIGELAAKQARLRDTIVCGRVGTLMPPWSTEQFGSLNDFQIDQLVALLTGSMPGFDPPHDQAAVSEKGWEAAVEEANHADELDKHLVQDVSPSATVLALNDVSGLEASTETDDKLLRVDDDPVDGVYEVVKVIAVREATDEIEVKRGAFGTTATEHVTGTEVFAGPIIPPEGPLIGQAPAVPPCGQTGVAAPSTATPGATPSDVPTPSAGQPERPSTAQDVQSEFVEPTDGVIETDSEDNFFTLNNFSVKVGEEVTIRLANPGLAPHNLRIAGLDGEWNSDDDFTTAILMNGEVGEFTFVLDQPATLVFRCDVHPLDMWGQITVSE
jgi:mono/diheme cytochrome c family protein/plastocyanin